MKIIELTVLTIAIGIVLLCAKNRTKIIHFKLLALAISLLISRSLGSWLGNTLLCCIEKFDKTIFSSQAVHSIIEKIAPTIGTIVTFLLLSVVIKHLASFISGEISSDMRTVVLDRLLGALDGLFIIVGFSFSFIEIVILVFTHQKLCGRELNDLITHDGNKKIKFVANLN